MTAEEKLELLLDLVAEKLIESQYVDSDNVADAQKFILNGQLEQGGGVGVLALFQKDIEANKEDLQITLSDTEGETIPAIQNIAADIDFDTLVITIGDGPTINISDDGTYVEGEEITPYLFGENNPLNVSQFITFEQSSSIVDIERANEYLDTNIFELLPTGDTRQARIIRFFQELNALLPPTIETEQWDEDSDGNVDRLIDGTWSGAEQYSQDNSISYAQDNPDESNIGEEDAFIHRLKDTANDTNSSRTIEDIYNTVRPYLRDILEDTPGLEGLPEYENQSSGYLKFRNLNQGIIVRNTNQEFIEGLNPSNPAYLNTDGTGGFTITMWVRFLDKVSEGTLFNFGNPLRDENPFGFKLETFVLNQDDRTYYETGGNEAAPGDTLYTWGSFAEGSSDLRLPKQDTFGNSNTARFVRLQVREEGTADFGVRDSHTGISGMRKMSWSYPEFNYRDGVLGSRDLRLIGSTFIPEDFQEWYFICASYNPNVIEPRRFGDGDNDIEPDIYDEYKSNKDFWLNHVDPLNDGNFTNFSGYGNKCKVEIISRSDLLRARGFNT